MKVEKRLVLDANILLRAVFGIRVLSLLETYEASVLFCCPDLCFDDARKHVPQIARRRGFNLGSSLLVLEQLSQLIEPIDLSQYGKYESSARLRISSRDASDWPIVATSLLLDCPIWTEDRDYFGIGIPVWSTANIELYLQDG